MRSIGALQPERKSGADNLQNHRALQGALLILTIILTLVGCALSPDPLIVLASGVSLVAIVVLMWANDGPSIFIMPCIYQWSEVAVKPILSAIERRPLAGLAEFGADLHTAAVFGFAAIVIFTAGLRLGFGKVFNGRLAGLRHFVEVTPPRTLITFCGVIILFGMAMEFAEPFSGPARQIVLGFSMCKHVGVFIMTFWALHNRRGYGWVVGLLAFQIIIGMTGFFAEFRPTLLAAGIAALCARPTFRATTVLIGGAAAAFVLLIGSFWSAYKPVYREWATDGSFVQTISRPMEHRIKFLTDYAGRFGPEEFAYGVNALLMRHSYIDYLAATLTNVPKNIPHENGARLAAATSHVLMPRVFFNDKAVLESDTDVTVYYSGAPITIDGVTSISLGYMGELYVDFGLYGAIIAAGFLGAIVGYAMRIFNGRSSRGGIDSYAVCLVAAIPLAAFGTALIKVVGAVIMGILVMFVFHRVIIPYLFSLSESWRGKRRHRSLMFISDR